VADPDIMKEAKDNVAMYNIRNVSFFFLRTE